MEDTHDTHEKEPVILTSPARMMKGFALIAITLAIAAAILLTQFNNFYSNPPPVTQLKKPVVVPPTPAVAGITTVSILSGAAVSGAPNYDPNDAKVPLGNKVVWINQDNVPHTATSGKGADDASSGAAFNTGIINAASKSNATEIKGAKVGDALDYYCQIHPYMKGKLTIAEASANTTATDTSPHAGTITILQGASVQGSKPYDPDNLTIKKGQEFDVVNADTLPHTVTSGTGADDANSGKAFNSGILEGGKTIHITLNGGAGTYNYYCMVHPYMKGKLTVTE